MNRTVSCVGISLIASFEGCRLEAYQCHSGVWTIGFGHTEGVKKGDKLKSEKEAREMLAQDVKKYETYVNAYDSIYHWTQNEFDALVSFTYNCGQGNLKNLLKNGTRTREVIRNVFLSYNKSRGIALPGLTRRRTAELKLFNTPDMVVEYFPKYEGESVVLDEVLESIGASEFYDKSFKNYQKRIPIAHANGITAYKGTAKQNIAIMALAKGGELIKP